MCWFFTQLAWGAWSKKWWVKGRADSLEETPFWTKKSSAKVVISFIFPLSYQTTKQECRSSPSATGGSGGGETGVFLVLDPFLAGRSHVSTLWVWQSVRGVWLLTQRTFQLLAVRLPGTGKSPWHSCSGCRGGGIWGLSVLGESKTRPDGEMPTFPIC